MVVECPKPEPELYSFRGRVCIKIGEKQYAHDLELKNFLHRVCFSFHIQQHIGVNSKKFWENLSISFIHGKGHKDHHESREVSL